jgi:hypothetical protein
MPDDAFDRVEEALRSGGLDAGFELLIRRFRDEKKYPLLFEARLMKIRRALGLPLIQTDNIEELSPEIRAAYERGFVGAAREVGGLFLADGDIPHAWPYFRTIGEPAPVADAIERVEPKEGIDGIIEIAFHERANPRKGFELILAQYGTCRAISFLAQYPDRNTRESCVCLLVRTLHHDVLEALKRTIAQREGQAPESQNVHDLIANRDWMFGEYDYYVDTSHLVSILRFSLDLTGRDALAMSVELAEYGTHLASTFQFRGDPPFEDGFKDYGLYLRALMGESVDEAVAHFRRKLADSTSEEVTKVTAQVLVGLLARLGRYEPAITISLDYLPDADPNQLFCPSVFQLCQMAGDYARLRRVARDRQDLLHFVAGALEG